MFLQGLKLQSYPQTLSQVCWIILFISANIVLCLQKCLVLH